MILNMFNTRNWLHERLAGLGRLVLAGALAACLAGGAAQAQAPLAPGKPPQNDTQPQDHRAEAERGPMQGEQTPMESEEEEDEEGGPGGQGCPYMGNKLELAV